MSQAYDHWDEGEDQYILQFTWKLLAVIPENLFSVPLVYTGVALFSKM